MNPIAAADPARVLTLDEIGSLASSGGKPAETLMNVVELIASRFQTDVCSAYLLEPDRANLVLAATVGLRPQCIGTLRMGLHEGLAGLVAEQVRPVAVEKAKAHPRFKYFQRSRRRSLPIVPRRAADRSRRAARRSGRANQEPRVFSEDEIRMLWRPPRKSRRWSAKPALSTASSRPRRNGSGPWPAISGGVGTTIPSACFATSIRSAGAQLNHNPSLAAYRNAAGEIEKPRRANWCCTAASTTPTAASRNIWKRTAPGARRNAGSPAPASGGVLLGGIRTARFYSRSTQAAWAFLPGDHIKSASDLDIPLVGIGSVLRSGILPPAAGRERLAAGRVSRRPMSISCRWSRPSARTANLSPLQIETRSGSIRAKVWRVKVGRCDLLLLDSNVEGNAPEDRELTSRLYGGDGRIRIRQELLLGVGGFRALKAMGITPGVLHLNEGHSGFAVLEAIRTPHGRGRRELRQAVAARFARSRIHHAYSGSRRPRPLSSPDLIEEHLGPLRDALGTLARKLDGLGPRESGQSPTKNSA